MRHHVTNMVASLAALALSACGGSENPASSDPTAAGVEAADPLGARWARSVATVYVVHGINGRDLGLEESLPVDVQVGDACALTGFRFRGVAGPLSLPPGSYDVKVRVAASDPCSGAIAVDAPGIALAAGDTVSIVAHLDDGTPPAPTATVFANDVTIDLPRARLVARHAAAFGPVDVRVDGAVAFAGVTNGEQGAASLAAGRRTVSISPAGSSTPAFETTLLLRPLKVYVAYAVGTPANGTFEVILQTLPMSRFPDPKANVTVVHGINGTDLGLAEGLPVDVQVGSACLLAGFTFRSIAGPVKVAAGSYDVSVRLAADPPCSGAAAVSAPGVRIAPGADVTIVAHLTDGGAAAAPTATVFANDTRPTRGKGRVTARHAANFGAVDVLVNGGVAFAGLENGGEATADLRRGAYEVAIAPAGTTTTVFDTTLDVKPGRSYTAYAVGTPSNGTFEVLLQERKIGRRWAWGWHHD